MLCCVLTGVVPSGWHELCSWSRGKPHILSFGFRLQDSRFAVSPSDKTRSQTGKGEQACEWQATGSEEAMVPPGPYSPGVLCSCPGRLSPKGLKRHRNQGEHSAKTLSSANATSVAR